MLVIVAAVMTVALIAYAWRPVYSPGRLRLALIRASLLTAAAAAAGIEALSWIGMLTGTGIALLWLFFVLVAVSAAAVRYQRLGRQAPNLAYLPSRARAIWSACTRLERAGLVALGVVVAVEVVFAFATEPNNYDSQTYHLPKIEQWASNGSVEFFASRIHRQVSLPPGGEYLLTHLRLASGGDAYYNYLQLAAGLACLLIVSRLCAQLGGNRRAQVLSVVVLGLTPMVVLQTASTQVDLVTAAWVGCVATVALDGVRHRASLATVVALGAGTGLIALTKTNGLLAVGPILVLWGLAQLRLAWLSSRRATQIVRTGVASVVILGLAAAVVGPYLLRVVDEFGHPLGPERVRDSIPMQVHDPASVFVNALRIGQSALDVPGATGAVGGVVVAIAETIGVDPQDEDITFHNETYPQWTWHPDEDKASFPITGALALLGFAACLIRPARFNLAAPAMLRGYAVTVAVAFVLYAATVKWQPWGNRLLLFLVVLAVPMAGLLLDRLLSHKWRKRWRHKVCMVTVVALLAVEAASAALSLGYGMPRRLVGEGATLVASDWDTRFVRRPEWKADYQWAAAQVNATNPKTVGLVQTYDSWEYPWWKLMPGRKIVALQSVMPKQPPAEPADVDAVVCALSVKNCAKYVPDDWQIHFRDYAGYALPPKS